MEIDYYQKYLKYKKKYLDLKEGGSDDTETHYEKEANKLEKKNKKVYDNLKNEE